MASIFKVYSHIEISSKVICARTLRLKKASGRTSGTSKTEISVGDLSFWGPGSFGFLTNFDDFFYKCFDECFDDFFDECFDECFDEIF